MTTAVHRDDDARVAAAQEAMPAAAVCEQVAATFGVLSDATRVRVVSMLSNREFCVGELALALGMSLSAVSHQLRILRQLGFVSRRRDGRHIYYRLSDQRLADLLAVATHSCAKARPEHAVSSGASASGGDEHD